VASGRHSDPTRDPLGWSRDAKDPKDPSDGDTARQFGPESIPEGPFCPLVWCILPLKCGVLRLFRRFEGSQGSQIDPGILPCMDPAEGSQGPL
jgi:hypothetical protein